MTCWRNMEKMDNAINELLSDNVTIKFYRLDSLMKLQFYLQIFSLSSLHASKQTTSLSPLYLLKSINSLSLKYIIISSIQNMLTINHKWVYMYQTIFNKRNINWYLWDDSHIKYTSLDTNILSKTRLKFTSEPKNNIDQDKFFTIQYTYLSKSWCARNSSLYIFSSPDKLVMWLGLLIKNKEIFVITLIT